MRHRAYINRLLMTLFSLVLVCGCATVKQSTPSPLVYMDNMFNQGMKPGDPGFTDALYHSRSYAPFNKLEGDPIFYSQQLAAPVNDAFSKIIGPTFEGSINSLAAKIWFIDNAEFTLDLTYYIFKYDEVGHAILGALCDAVRRGVDIRIMVDSLGSIHPTHAPIKALQTCEREAGFIKDINGQPTDLKARVQFVVINALTSWRSWANRRSHDKLIIKDGFYPGKDMLMTGGRNISLDYYGIDAEGKKNPDTFLDLEIMLRSPFGQNAMEEDTTIGSISSLYFSMLFLHEGNRLIKPGNDAAARYVKGEDHNTYSTLLVRSQHDREFFMSNPTFRAVYDQMNRYVSEGFSSSKVRLAHQLENFKSTNVVAKAEEIKAGNANSIEGILKAATEEAVKQGNLAGTLRIVSPYLFVPQYENEEGEVIHDGAILLRQLLAEHPELEVEIITNSVLTSDNFYTQSVIDMDTAPRLLLSEAQIDVWREDTESSEFDPAFIGSEEWLAAIDNPRIRIYQTGLADSTLVGGDKVYGKLHAKFFFSEDMGFVGTSNFDYRSRLYNTEMGYYFLDEQVSQDLMKSFDELKAISMRWGTPEWLAMRKTLMEQSSVQGFTTKTQRSRYRNMKISGLIWLF